MKNKKIKLSFLGYMPSYTKCFIEIRKTAYFSEINFNEVVNLLHSNFEEFHFPLLEFFKF